MSANRFVILKGNAGFGDRLNTLLETIEYAQRTNRILVVDWRDSHWSHDGTTGFEHYFNINMENYMTMDEFVKIYSWNPRDSMLQPAWKFSIYPNIWKGNITHRILGCDDHANCKLGIKCYYSNTYRQWNTSIQEIYKRGKDIIPSIVVCPSSHRSYYKFNYFKFIVPKDYLLQKIINVMKLNEIKPNTYDILHLRTCDKEWNGGRRLAKTQDVEFIKSKNNYFQYLAQQYETTENKADKLIIISDSIKLAIEWSKLYTKGNVLKNRKHIENGVSGIHDTQSILPISKVELNDDTLIDYYLMIFSKNIISDGDSYFSNSAKQMKNHCEIILDI